MFDLITIRRQDYSGTDSPLDLGFLAEAMLFYSRVRVISDPGMLRQLVVSLGPDLLIEFLKEDFLELTYLENNLIVATQNAGTPLERHDLGLVSSEKQSLQNYAPTLLQEVTGKQGRGRRLANRITDRTEPYSYDEEVKAQTIQDFADSEYVLSAIKQILTGYAPHYRVPDEFEFSIAQESGLFSVSTNIDFEAANESYHRLVPAEHSTLTSAYLLSLLMTTRSHLSFASENSAELALESVNASLVQLKMSTLLTSRIQSANNLEIFQEFVFDEARAVREAINGGRRCFEDLRDVLKQAREFKKWLVGQDPEEGLLKAYFQESFKDSWIEKLPLKAFRWSVLALGGTIGGLAAGPEGAAVGSMAATALSAADTFLLERFTKGWNPSSFVNDRLKPFVKK